MPEPKTPIRPEESLAKMMEGLEEKTGKSLDQWKQLVAEKGWKKHGEIMTALKSDYSLSHGYANQIALRALKGDESETLDPVQAMFAKRPEVRPIYDLVLARIQEFGADVDLAAKKGYLSVRRKKQFAILQPAAGRLDVGIQLKGVEPEGKLEASGSFNTMLTHRVRVANPAEVDDQLIDWLRSAYQAAG